MTVSTSLSKHTAHSPSLLPWGSGANTGDTGGLSGELGAVTREDSEAEEERFTLKTISESLSYWEPLGEPDGESTLDCTVPIILS